MNNKKYIFVLLGLLLPIMLLAEPSGRGADMETEPTSLASDLHSFLLGVCLLIVGGVCYFRRERHKAYEVIAWIGLIIGGISAFVGGWALLSKFVLFPVFYLLKYILLALLYIGIVVVPYAAIYIVGRKITDVPLRMIFYVTLAALCIWGEYYVIAELGAYELFPKWNFMNEFNANLHPVEE